MTPTINEKNFEPECFFSYFVEILLGSVYNPKIIFFLMFTLRCMQAGMAASVSLPVWLLSANNYRQGHEIVEIENLVTDSLKTEPKGKKWRK